MAQRTHSDFLFCFYRGDSFIGVGFLFACFLSESINSYSPWKWTLENTWKLKEKGSSPPHPPPYTLIIYGYVLILVTSTVVCISDSLWTHCFSLFFHVLILCFIRASFHITGISIHHVLVKVSRGTELIELVEWISLSSIYLSIYLPYIYRSSISLSSTYICIAIYLYLLKYICMAFIWMLSIQNQVFMFETYMLCLLSHVPSSNAMYL